MGVEFILLGWNLSHGHGIHPTEDRVHPVGQQGEAHSHSPSLESGSAQSARKLEPLLSLISFFCFLGVCLFVWVVFGVFLSFLFVWMGFCLFFVIVIGILGGNPCFPSQARLREVRRLWWWIFPIHDYYAVLSQASLPAAPGISPPAEGFSPKTRGVSPAWPQPRIPKCPLPAEPLPVSPSAPAPCPGSVVWIPWITGMAELWTHRF